MSLRHKKVEDREPGKASLHVTTNHVVNIGQGNKSASGTCYCTAYVFDTGKKLDPLPAPAAVVTQVDDEARPAPPRVRVQTLGECAHGGFLPEVLVVFFFRHNCWRIGHAEKLILKSRPGVQHKFS